MLGSSREADVSISGGDVEPVHCTIENNNGVVTLHPENGSTYVDGAPVNSSVRLAQGIFTFLRFKQIFTLKLFQVNF